MNIYPSYKCNLNCDFCSLCHLPGEMISLEWMDRVLTEHPVLAHNINILGGEPSIIPEDYLKELVRLCVSHAEEKPYLITNLLKPLSACIRGSVKPIVSWDFQMRKHSTQILTNILTMSQPFAISTILSSDLINQGAQRYLHFIDMLPACERADLVLYRSGTTDTDHTPDHDKLMAFVKDVMDHPKVNLTPYSNMKGIINNGFDNIADRFGLLPDNKIGVRIDYREGHYTPFDTYSEALAYYNKRIQHIRETVPCKGCEFFGHCWCVGGFEDGVCHGDKEMMYLFQEGVTYVSASV